MDKSDVVLVTGASSGFGREIASLLAERGYRVYGTFFSHKPDEPVPFVLLPLDVTEDRSVNDCVETVMAIEGRLDVLVNNAGVELLGAVEETSIDEAKWVFDVNFFGTARMVRAVLPIMHRHGKGKIVNMSSLAGLVGSPIQAFYIASKHALEG